MELTHRLLTRSGEELARISLAANFRSRLIGLMGARPAPDTGLYLRGVNSIHMLLMKTPIDLFFLGAKDADGYQSVRSIRIGLRPWLGLAMSLRSSDTVELAPGSIAGLRLRVGDQVRIEPIASR